MTQHLFPISLTASLLLLGSGAAWAQAPAAAASDGHSSHHPTATASPAPQAELSDGEITRWDPRTGKVTLRHGEIKNLGMPPMTMVFRVTDASMLAPFKPGDKVRFRVEQRTGAYIVTRMEAAR